MPDMRSRRGRPKGSGIDDRKRLAAIARLIAENPALKPTTAIRTLGVSDPSVIRRLRDKFNLVRNDLMDDLADGARAERRTARAAGLKAPASANASRRRENARAIAASVTSSPKLIAAAPILANPTVETPSPIRAVPRQPSAPVAARAYPSANDDDGERRPAADIKTQGGNDVFLQLMGAGLVATSNIFAMQAAFAAQLVRSPCVSLAVRQQLTFNDWATGLVPGLRRFPKTAN